MNKIAIKLLELEEARECIERCQRKLREQMITLDKDEYSKKRTIYNKNKEELKEVNEKIEILNNAMDILEDIDIQ